MTYLKNSIKLFIFPEFPWMALLKYQVDQKFKFTCGSTLISSRYVLTAGKNQTLVNSQ